MIKQPYFTSIPDPFQPWPVCQRNHRTMDGVDPGRRGGLGRQGQRDRVRPKFGASKVSCQLDRWNLHSGKGPEKR
jgi:hypothetical protein